MNEEERRQDKRLDGGIYRCLKLLNSHFGRNGIFDLALLFTLLI